MIVDDPGCAPWGTALARSHFSRCPRAVPLPSAPVMDSAAEQGSSLSNDRNPSPTLQILAGGANRAAPHSGRMFDRYGHCAQQCTSRRCHAYKRCFPIEYKYDVLLWGNKGLGGLAACGFDSNQLSRKWSWHLWPSPPTLTMRGDGRIIWWFCPRRRGDDNGFLGRG
jgi:hypothetical protein